MALEKVRKAGARRPGLVVSKRYDDQIGGYISGAFWSVVSHLPEKDRIQPLMDWRETDPEDFLVHLIHWWAETKPDCILTNRKGFSPAN